MKVNSDGTAIEYVLHPSYDEVTGSFSIAAGEKLFTGANENEYIQTDTTDRMRFVVGGNQMLLLDEDDGRVNVGYGMKLGVGLGNNTNPGEMLEVVGNISGSGTGSFSDNMYPITPSTSTEAPAS